MRMIDFPRFERLLLRCKEIGTQKDVKAPVAKVYKDILEAPAQIYLDAHSLFVEREAALTKENNEAAKALADIDQPYTVARATALAYIPTLPVPDTLKRQPTDTDKVNAVEELLDYIDDYAGQPWADDLLNGDFGVKAPQTIQEINEAIAANKELGAARAARTAAYAPAYEPYLAFKRIVRAAYGPSSVEYRRIHLKASPGGGEGEGGGNEGGEPGAGGGEPGPA